ncbi:pyrroline-5-carboxylate reductase [bacterium]|nr:pyrroline-5-carboxylate reductase [bacterium]
MSNKTGIGFMGAGKMGGALLEAVLAAGLSPAVDTWVVETDQSRLAELQSRLGVQGATPGELAAHSGVVLLCVKPHLAPGALAQLKGGLGPDTLVISIAAGVTLATLEAAVPTGVPVVRAMPNLAATLGQSATVYSGGSATKPEHLALAGKVLGAAGAAVELPEGLLDAVTGLSGSGPAWVFLFAEALIAGGVKAGLPHAAARRLAVQTLSGAAALLAADEKVHPAALRDAVTTPGGTTAAGLHVLEAKGLRDAVISAVLAAAERARELGRTN